MTYEATRGVVLATGGEPAAPPIEGLADIAYWTNREAIEAEEVPRRLVVLRDTIYPYPTFIRGFEGALGPLDV